jgi:mRNA interferase MazF
MNPGDVIWIKFPGVVQTKMRPPVALLSSTFHADHQDIILGLITSQTSKATSRTDYLIQSWQAAGLRVPSAFRSFVVSLPASAVVSTVVALATLDWEQVVARFNLAIELV